MVGLFSVGWPPRFVKVAVEALRTGLLSTGLKLWNVSVLLFAVTDPVPSPWSLASVRDTLLMVVPPEYVLCAPKVTLLAPPDPVMVSAEPPEITPVTLRVELVISQVWTAPRTRGAVQTWLIPNSTLSV